MRRLALLLALLGSLCGSFDPVRKLEVANLYGNIHEYQYYFVDITVGTPLQRVSVILDTGSGLLAFPCAGCKHCGSHIDPLFDVSKSSSAKWVPCGGKCRTACKQNQCSYSQSYLEGSSISGYWFEDFLYLGDSFQENPGVLARMGCHRNENNLFYTQKANGIFGIQGPQSLLHTIFADKEHVDSRTFTVCLAREGGHLTVGGYNSSNHRKGYEIQYMKQLGDHYRVKLSQVEINGEVLTGFQNTMIDSGTTYTYFASKHYRPIRAGIERVCKDGSCGAKWSGSCYSGIDNPKDLHKFPVIKVSFQGGASINWYAEEYLYRAHSGKWCYAFENDGNVGTTTLGASWMLYKDVIFDLANGRIGIVPSNCPSHTQRPAHVPRIAPHPKIAQKKPKKQESSTEAKTTSSTAAAAAAAAAATEVTTSSSTSSTSLRSTSIASPASSASSSVLGAATTKVPEATEEAGAVGWVSPRLLGGGFLSGMALACLGVHLCKSSLRGSDNGGKSTPADIVGTPLE